MTSVEEPCGESLADEQLFSLSAAFMSVNLNLQALPQSQPQQLSPAALAYIGDAVYELYIRTYYLLPPKRVQLYHQLVVAQVRAESQAHHLQTLQTYLTPTESEIVRRGRNAAKRPKRADPEVYQQATGLEALFGYLYLSDRERLIQLLQQLQLTEITISEF
jgi:ribonuclease-3 family protein